jgi:hypothetical protein
LILAFSAAALIELRRGRILKVWQIERGLGVKVLGEVSLP